MKKTTLAIFSIVLVGVALIGCQEAGNTGTGNGTGNGNTSTGTGTDGGNTGTGNGNTSAKANITWTHQTRATRNTLLSITYGNNLFVAVGNRGTIVTSPDARMWTDKTDQTDDTNQSLSSITHGNNLFVVVGQNGRVLTSPDATTWTIQNSNTNKSLYSITYGNNLFVAVGDHRTILTSPDGITWTNHYTDKNGNNKFDYGESNVHNYSISEITYADDKFIGTGKTFTYNGNHTSCYYYSCSYYIVISTSTDGTKWERRNINVGTNSSNISQNRLLNHITYSKHTYEYVAVGSYGTIYTSINGTTWTNQYTDENKNNRWDVGESDSGTHQWLYGITYNNNLFVAVGSYGTILTSPYGITWTSQTRVTRQSLNSITYGKNKYVVVGSNGIILTGE